MKNIIIIFLINVFFPHLSIEAQAPASSPPINCTMLQAKLDSLEHDHVLLGKKRDRDQYWKRIAWTTAAILAIILVLALIICIAIIVRFYQNKSDLEKNNALLAIANAEMAISNNHISQQRDKLDLLLRETHHRFKNTLQDISSLLYLQSEEIIEPSVNAKSALEAARQRIEIFSLIHNLLFQKTEASSMVRIKELVENLVRNFIKNNGSGVTVKTDLSIQNIEVDTDFAYDFGLIINELMQNFIKYAMPQNPTPVLSIAVERRAHKQILIIVKDNGPGFSISARYNFGLTLIQMLTEGRDGSMEIRHERGTTFNIILNEL